MARVPQLQCVGEGGKIAATVLRMWKSGEAYDPGRADPFAKTYEGCRRLTSEEKIRIVIEGIRGEEMAVIADTVIDPVIESLVEPPA